MRTFLTPEIVHALSAPAVQERIDEINSCLVRGVRYVTCEPGIAEACADGLRAAGWTVEVRRASTTFSALTISAPIDVRTEAAPS